MVQIFRSTAQKSAKSHSLNKIIELDINDLDHQGRGVGRYNGKVCFVQGALPSEKVQAIITEDKKQLLTAKLHKILQVSDERIEPNCPWFSECGGCQLQHLSYAAQTQQKQTRVDQLLAKQGIKRLPWQPILNSQPFQYRNRTRLSAWYEGKQNKLHLGFRQFNSKKLIEVDQCLVIAPKFSTLLPELVQILNKLKCKKHVSHVELNSAGQRYCIILRVLNKPAEQDYIKLTEFALAHNLDIYFHQNDDEYLKVQSDSDKLYYSIDSLQLQFGLSDFTQVNSQANKDMIQQAQNWLELNEDDVVLDLFCGLGNFSLPVAQKVLKVVGIEGSRSMVEKAKRNASDNQLTNTEFYKQDLSSIDGLDKIDWGAFNKIILDPSRQGAMQICQQSEQWTAKQVLYIACDPNSLARDSQYLLASGYKMIKIGLIDMFPQTSHIETMALFSR
ncbi:23S rRNA (uracil(1939)-C(5))-methyltransferase RlmD [Catenovulum adriaticum]|uniref:23S rRNA (Uracil(1939)-C(5))-methyltransferase RlmD n=1 Tax=Catenovulum adriaticum TaxID=2984846 RepID=A0ABY7AJX2_9ALTE|nr:23S rRNA (uracil(1939)-C(5))-methyltransferase RlmD [Catenovulum sp. TS8]WAJ69557.1 23S rRNA (uracil(1939)-C(5))-methyltransferase RlmD [Catenovulum sp. TS8]